MFLPPSIPMLLLFIFALLCAPHHHFLLTAPPPPFPCPHAPLLYGCLLFTCMPLSFSFCLPRPPSFSWVISLSYVCPSLYVCVPPLFVSDSFSREIRDAYLVPLFSTSAAALSYTVQRWPRHKMPHLHIMCLSYPNHCRGFHAE